MKFFCLNLYAEFLKSWWRETIEGRNKVTARENILARLRAGAPPAERIPPAPTEDDRQWRAKQPPLGDLAEAFIRGQEAAGGRVLRVKDWAALPSAMETWFSRAGVRHFMAGLDPRLMALTAYLAENGRTPRLFDAPLGEQKDDVFNTDCGITCSAGGIAETGSVVLIPSPEEPRLLSLAMPIHLAIVERSRLFPTLADYIESGEYQQALPSNLVLATGPSRTADIELVLALGVHGPREQWVALIG